METFFSFTIIVETILAITFIAAPRFLMASFGATLDDLATTGFRMFGSAMLSFPLLLWYARRSRAVEYKRNIVTSLFVAHLVSTAVVIMAQFSGQMNALGWMVVALHVVLVVGFGYSFTQLRRRRARRRRIV